MNEKDAYIMHLENTIKDLQNQVSNLTEIIMLLRKDKFGSSSEKTPKNKIPGQLSLFNEADSSAPEPITRDIKVCKRVDHKTKRDELIKDLPVREVPCDLPDNEKFCGQCGTSLKPLGKETVREELEYIPAQLRIIRYVRWTYECPRRV